MEHFKVNEHLTLKQEHEKTVIYVAGERFRQCAVLLLEIPVEEITELKNIESIDEAAQRLTESEDFIEGTNYNIPPEVEFWGHCSNLQAWAEFGYDTRLLHRNLAFPLLKALVDAGDLQARKVFKEEIMKRLNSHWRVFYYLIDHWYVQYLDEEELEVILESTSKDLISFIYSEFFNHIINDLLPEIGDQLYEKEFKTVRVQIKAYFNGIRTTLESKENLGIYNLRYIFKIRQLLDDALIHEYIELLEKNYINQHNKPLINIDLQYSHYTNSS